MQEHGGSIEAENPIIDKKTHKQEPGAAFHPHFPATKQHNINAKEHL